MSQCARCNAAPTFENPAYCALCLEWWREEYGAHENFGQRLNELERQRDEMAAAIDFLIEKLEQFSPKPVDFCDLKTFIGVSIDLYRRRMMTKGGREALSSSGCNCGFLRHAPWCLVERAKTWEPKE